MSKTRGLRGEAASAAAAFALLALCLLVPAAARAQWTTCGTNNVCNNGNVGVGATPNPPPARLDVEQPSGTNGLNMFMLVSRGNSNSDKGQILFRHTDQYTNLRNTAAIRWETTPGMGGMDGKLSFHTNNGADVLTQRMTIDAFGNVGIGTDSPATLLHVASSGLGTMRLSGDRAVVGFVDTAAPDNQKQFQWRSERGVFRMSLVNDTDGSFLRQNILAATAAGRVGIGTDSPQDPVHIQTAGNDGLRITSTDASNSAIVRLYGLNGGVEMQMESGRGGNTSADIQTYSNHDLWFGTNHTERMRITAGGNVGIGTGSPAAALNIVGSGVGQAGAVRLDNGAVQTQLASDATQGFGQFGTVTNHGLNIVTNNSSKVFITAGGNVGVNTPTPTHTLEVNGTIHAAGGITGGSFQATYQDVAEWVPSMQKLAAGTVVVLDPDRANQVVTSTEAYDTRVAGVVSAQPGIALGQGGEGKVLVATTGRVKVRVDATRAPVRIGDLLVTGETPGVAMKSEPVAVGGRKMHAPGTIVGKALEPLAAGRGEILVLLSLQ